MHDLIVVSDLHLGRGLDPESGHYRRLETFFYDEDFYGFCRYLCDEAATQGRPFKLVFNGDAFDLLRIEPDRDPDAGPRERRFGPTLTPPVAARTVAQILEGHVRFVDALGLVLAAGHEVLFLPGNHDIELQWPQVQEVVRRAVVQQVQSVAGGAAAESASARLAFKSWFHHEPGRIWIEHGCQYDPDNAFRFPLRGGLAHLGQGVFRAEEDMPLGNFFQRYLYNAFGNITFIVPSTRANARYFKWLLLNQPGFLVRVLASHVPFAFQLLRRMARAGGSTRAELAQAHQEQLQQLAEQSALGDRLLEIDKLKHVGADVVRAAGDILRQSLKLAVGVSVITVLGAALWSLGSQAISELEVGLAPKALLSVTMNLLILAALVLAILIAVVRQPKTQVPRPLRRAARQIVGILDVPLVTFGHTHDEVISRLTRPSGGPAWYYNTGTWIAVFTHDVLIPRERVQFTFLRVREHKGELLHWSPGRNQPLRVVLLEEHGHPDVVATPSERHLDQDKEGADADSPRAKVG